jgi:NADH-quinone oxidoreductase subunit G
MPDKVTITINGRECKAAPGRTVLQTALDNGIYIPHFCWHPGLSIAGNCRICAVEVEGAPKLVISCNEQVRDGMVIHTDSEKVLRARASVLEFLLINHPLDCSVCDKAGECVLQNYTYDHGRFPGRASTDSRMRLPKIVPTTKELSSKIWIWANRCIHCSRCVRFCNEIAGTGELTFTKRGAHTEIDCHPGRPIENDLALNVVDICPVGALLNKEFLYSCRVWFLDRRDSVCPHCSRGCNIHIESFRNEVKRLMPRANSEVNGFWMCDLGRLNFSYFGREDRIKHAEVRINGRFEQKPRSEALKEIAARLREIPGAKIAGIGSAQSTCEDNYALRLLVEQLGGKVLAMRETHKGKGEKFKAFEIEAEKAPNSCGATTALGVKQTGSEALCEQIEAGKIEAAIALGNELNVPLSERERSAFAKLKFLLVLDSWRSDLAGAAHALLPAADFSEKDGTFVNSAGRVQRIHQCLVPEASEAASEWIWLKRLSDELEGDWDFGGPSSLFEAMAERLEPFSGMTYAALDTTGLLLKK